MTDTAAAYARESVARRYREDAREYRWIYATTLALFVVVVALDRVFGRRSVGAGAATRETLMDEARGMAHTAIPFAYMR